jgi:hypothetical protein
MAITPKPREHLGVGWAFPVRPVNGRLTYARYEDDVEQVIAAGLRHRAAQLRLRLQQPGDPPRDRG